MRRLAETLYVGVLQLGPVGKDILNQTDRRLPTFVNAMDYHAFYWTGVKTGSEPITFTVLGGNSQAWLWTYSGQIIGEAGQWFRVVVKPPAAFAWYRFEVVGGSQTLHSKITGVRR